MTVRSSSGRNDARPDAAAFPDLLRDALGRLYDPVYLQKHPLTIHVRRTADEPGASVGRRLEAEIAEAIDALGAARDERGRALLRGRYVDALEVPELCRRLGLSRSQFYVEHRRALDALTAVLHERWTVDQPPPPAAQRTNLPGQVTSFVGREAELAQVKRLLGTTRLLTLTGTGGCGKTRLAVRAAEAVLDDYRDGVWFVDLAPISDEALVARTVLDVVAKGQVSAGPDLDGLVEVLRGRTALVVLDNCEHVLPACAELGDALLRSCPGVTVLATSRELLGIGGEVAWRVPSLPVPDEAAASEAELDRFASSRLFVERARAARPDFAVTPENAPAIAQVCRRLDGIPLAVELAAARVRVLSVREVAARLDDRFRLLTGGSRTALRRQQTLQAMVDWSHDLLTPSERAVLRRLSVFAGGFALGAAEAVCPDPAIEPAGVAPADVLELVLGLADKSLVVAEPTGGETRYRLLETIRQYANQKLVDAGEAGPVRDAHLAWAVELAESAEVGFRGSDQIAWALRMAAEHDNVRTAIEWAAARPDAQLGLRVAGALWHVWEVAGRYVEATDRYAAVLAVQGADAPTRARALALLGYGVARRQCGDHAGGIGTMRRAVDLATELGDRWVTATAVACAAVFVRGPDPVDSRAGLERAYALFEELDDLWGLAFTARQIGFGLLLAGEPAAARPWIERAREASRETGNTWLMWGPVGDMGNLALTDGDYATARRLFEEVLDAARALNSPRAVGSWLVSVGRAALAAGDLDDAEARLREALRLLRDLSNRGPMCGALVHFATLAVERGRPGRAFRLGHAARSIATALGTGLLAHETAELTETLRRARALDPAAESGAAAAGGAMALEEAVAYALSGED